MKKLLTGAIISISILNMVACGSFKTSNKWADESVKFMVPDSEQKITKICGDIDYGSIKIETGEKFAVKADNIEKDKYEIKVSGDTLKIQYKNSKKVKLAELKSKSENFIITVPENKKFEEINFDSGCSEIVYLDALCKNIYIHSGTGEVQLSGAIDNKIDIDLGVGEVKLKLKQKKLDSYNADCSTGVGTVEVNKQNYDQDFNKEIENYESDINIKLGVGDINISDK